MHDNAGNERPPTPITAATRRTADPGRIPPHNIEAEESLLGALMLSTDAVRAAQAQAITAASFYKPTHSTIYTAVIAVHDRGAAVDPVLLADELRHTDQLANVGGLAALLKIQAATPASANAAHYAHIVDDNHRRREIMAIAATLIETAERGGDIDPILDRAREHAYRQIIPTELLPIDWQTVWQQRELHADWLVEPILPLGTQVLLYAPKKTGKSLLILEIVAALAAGRPVLDQPQNAPQDVLVIDFENTIEEDIIPRLEDLGYTPDDLTHLHFYSFPRIQPLDTDAGARRLEELIVRHQPCLVVLDSFQRIVGGPENDADTVRAYYQHTGVTLKRHKVTSIRLDNTGKDETAGARGSSAKGDDVDLIWRLKRADDGYRLIRDAQRGTLAPEEINLQRVETPYLHHRVVAESWPAGTRHLVERLDALNVPTSTSIRETKTVLRAHNETASNELLTKAVKYRRLRRPEEMSQTEPEIPGARSGPISGTTESPTNGTRHGTPQETPSDQGGTPDGTPRNTNPGNNGTRGVSLDPPFRANTPSDEEEIY